MYPCAPAHETSFIATSSATAHQVMHHAHGHMQGVLFARLPSHFLWQNPIFTLLIPK